MRILITGGAGFIGRHLAEPLVSDGHDVTVFDNLKRGRRPETAGLRFIQGDIRDAEAIGAACAGMEAVVHLAAQSTVAGSEEDPEYTITTNTDGTRAVLRAAHQAGVRRVVVASSREVYGDSPQLPVSEDAPLAAKNTYGASKVAGEAACGEYAALGLEINILRFANVYGPGDSGRVVSNFLSNALAGKPLRINGGEQVLDFVWIGIAVEALRRATFGARLPGPVNVGSGEGVSLHTLAERVLTETRSSSAIEQAPARQFETVRFVACMERASRYLGLSRQTDPLSELATMVAAEKARQ